MGWTDVTGDLYYSGGYLGTLKIPAIDLSTKVYQGTGSSVLAKGAGHFPDTSIWAGNVCIAGHNRGVRDDFGDLHTLEPGDTVTWTTKLGTRTYEVVSVQKVLETDTSGTTATSDDRMTLYTCVRDQREYRWCVTAVFSIELFFLCCELTAFLLQHIHFRELRPAQQRAHFRLCSPVQFKVGLMLRKEFPAVLRRLILLKDRTGFGILNRCGL